ncbi:MAG: putative N-acetylmannosamine-6-phosphate 2-epimerase [Cyanobacteria bacterium NC_groundwater_1444_Ag_S-0.65um_54_12]|nr:putative N-acetylmannosamine-6-phosphate 2-epimerase [Cyanobacteria bacterium NC_groundwater_1444_Ag_S-0.65um_54_12]
MDFLQQIAGKLVVSCQAQSGEPLHGSIYMVKMAQAAAMAGAAAIRAESPPDIAAIKAATSLPVLGLWKFETDGGHWARITPTFEAASQIAAAGADAIAIEATPSPRPDGQTLATTFALVHRKLGKLIVADISTLAEGLAAVRLGADAVATTLAGYTSQSGGPRHQPDFELLSALVAQCSVPVLLEGHVWYPEQAKEGLRRGAHAVVVGSAITRPQLIAKRFVEAIYG